MSGAPMGPGIKKIRGNMTAHPDWELTGELYKGMPIYREPTRAMKKIPRLDNEGKEIWVKHQATGVPVRQVFDRVPDPDAPQWREFVQVDLGNGIVKKNYDFRPSDADARRVAEQNVNKADLASQVAALQAQLEAIMAEKADAKPAPKKKAS